MLVALNNNVCSELSTLQLRQCVSQRYNRLIYGGTWAWRWYGPPKGIHHGEVLTWA
jgi:hypothetical protein